MAKNQEMIKLHQISEVKETDIDEPYYPRKNSNGRPSVDDSAKIQNDEEANNASLLADKKNNSKSFPLTNRMDSTSRFGVFSITGRQTNLEKWLMERTGLSRSGLICFVILFLLLIFLILCVVTMACMWPRLPHAYSFPVCRSSSCLMASSQVISHLNESVDACSQYREFACGKWLKQHAAPEQVIESRGRSVWSAKTRIQHKHHEKVRDMITTMTVHTYDPDKIQIKVKNMYDSCMSLGSIETEGVRPLRKVISQLGGWKVLRDFSLSSWDIKRTWKLLHKDFGVQPFFSVDVVPHPLDPLQSIIQISPGSLGLPDKMFYLRRSSDRIVVGYKRFMKDLVMVLGATSDDASIFAEDMYGFEKRLAERFPTSWSHPRPHPRPTIAKLQQIAPSIPFFDILTAMFPKARLSLSTEVIAVASDHLVNISRIISSTDRSVLNDYMMWRLAVIYTPYLSQELRNASQTFNSILYGSHGEMPRWEMCVEVVENYIGLGLETIVENQHASDLETKQKAVKDIFEHIRSTTISFISKSSKLTQAVKDHFLEKMETLKIEVGVPVYMRHHSYCNEYYRTLTTYRDDFFKNVEFGVLFKLEEQEKRLLNHSEEHRWVDLMTNGVLKVSYVKEINKVIVPFPLLSTPYFHSDYPLVVQYGGLGAEIAAAMVDSVYGRGMFHAADGALLPRDHPLSNFSHDCFLLNPSAVPQMEALKITHAALMEALGNTEHVHQPALEQYEDDALFFIIFAQSLCTSKTKAKIELDAILNSQLDDSLILNEIRSKSFEFRTAFSCNRVVMKDSCYPLM